MHLLFVSEPGEIGSTAARFCAEALGETAQMSLCSGFDNLPQVNQQPAEVIVLLAAAADARSLPTVRVSEALETISRKAPAWLVLVSSAAVEAPRHVHPGMVRERLCPPRGVDPTADAWLAIEELTRTVCERHGIELTILRPAAMPFPGTRDPIARLARGGLVATAVGHDPPVQLLAPEDLGSALARVVQRGAKGLYHVAPNGAAPLHDVIRLSGGHRVPLPMWKLRAMKLAARTFGGPPVADAERLRYTATVSGEQMTQDMGFTARHSTAEAASRSRGGDTGKVPHFDDFGQNPAYISLLRKTWLRLLHDVYWRVQIEGGEQIPRSGAAVLTGMHRGFMPFDGTMALFGVARESGRLPRFLIHPSLAKMPFLANFIRRQGGLMACRDNADRVLQSGELLGVFPEGIDGAFSRFTEAYQMRRDWGRDEFVKAALRNQVPIVPFVTVGSVEIFPVLAKIDWGWWQRFTAWPCFPIAPPFPIAPIPLPTKWHTRFLEPMPIHEQHPPDAAEDPATVRAIGDQVRERMQQAVDDMLARRRHIFFGRLAVEAPSAGA
jgi:1-acyl-sn-glycerol-3-phosphate acyltransferase/nucleoside-diphosphate-sugar epimerase